MKTPILNFKNVNLSNLKVENANIKLLIYLNWIFDIKDTNIKLSILFLLVFSMSKMLALNIILFILTLLILEIQTIKLSIYFY